MPGIFGDGQRGGIFGAKVDPRLLQMVLEQRAEAERQRQAAEQSTIGSRARDWWNKSTFFKPAWDDLVGGLTAPGDVMSGAQPTMAADPQTGEFHTAPSLMDRAGALAGAVTLGAGTVPAEADALRMGIKAYHASPHDFERFDASKIGTGQGAQTFGHGIYVAENPRVSGRGGQYDREFTAKKLGQSDTTPQQEYILNRLDEGASDLDILKGLAQGGGTDFEQAQGMLDTVKANRAKIYEVDIAADPEHFLDWDKPLSEQSPQVREKLLQTGDPAKVKALEAEHRQAYDDYMSRPENTSTGDLHRMERRVEQTYDAWRKEIGNAAKSGAGVYSELAGGGKFATGTEKLKEMGIPGIRYLDQGSRGAAMYDVGSPRADFGPYTPFRNRADAEKHLALLKRMGETDAEIKEIGKQTSNYVVFDDKLISILKKYGLPISAAGLAALSQLHPQEAQAAQRKPRK